MLFNSLKFAFFFFVIFALYFALRNRHKWQNRMLLVASCIFYGSWDYRFLFLMFTSIATDFICSNKIDASFNAQTRKKFLAASIIVNLGILGFFKYFNFFADSFRQLINSFGFSCNAHFLKIILPVGISFYTFQSMSYTLDVYRKEMKPTRNFFDYALFVTFFPQLVAGPIMRAKDLLPQIISSRKITLNKVYEGFYFILWGLFQKIFVADNLAKIVESVFSSGPDYNGIQVLLALYAFAFQIYCDFAGYSNIAIGLGNCMGFNIMTNFNLPYFSTNPKEFWSRWHISLSTWLKDYLYIPLGGNKKGKLLTYRNLAITMLLGGLWHGAAWTFVLWGTYHGLLLIIHRMLKPLFEKISAVRHVFAKKIILLIKIIFFFHLVCLGWLLFRSQSISQAFLMLKSVFINFTLEPFVITEKIGFIIFFVWFLLLVQIVQFIKNDLAIILKSNYIILTAFYFIVFYSMVIYGVMNSKEFIYFQF